MLRDEIAQYTELSGNDGLHTPIGIIGAYLDGYEKGKADAQQWIPVTERLPEEKQDVLLAFRHNMVVGFWEDILNDGGQAWYANSGNGWFTGTESVDDDGFPIAWMPLPEPWKGEDDAEID